MGCALVALLLVGDLCPEGMPDRCRGPLHERLSEELWTREAPVHPGLLPAAFRDRCTARIFLQCGGSGLARALFPKGNEEAGGEDRPSAWEGLAEGAVGMGLGPRRDGRVERGDGLQGDAELGHQRLDHQGMRGHDALIGGQRRGGLDGVAALCDHGCRGHGVVAEEGRKGGAAREVGRYAGGPAAQKVTEHGGILVLQPWQHRRERVFQRPGETVRKAHFLPDHAPPRCDELCEGAHGGALRMERRQLVPMRAQQCALQCGVGGIVCGPAGGEGFAIPCQRQRMDRAEDQKVILAQGADPRPFGECEAESHRVAVKPRTQRGAPRVDGLGRVLKLEALPLCGTSGLEAPIMVGIRPVEPNKGRKGVV
jgi:hypothetical protein